MLETEVQVEPSAKKALPLVPKNLIFPFILLTSLFAWWGLANNMTDTLLAAFKRIMSMSDSKTAYIQVVCYLFGYGFLAIPAAIFIKKYSYKAGVLLGLGLYSVGAMLFWPAATMANYYFYLGAIWILFSGLSILETAANPYIISMGPEETATRRLNFAQSFNPMGSIIGVLLSQFFILSNLSNASAEQRAAMSPEQLIAIQDGELNAVSLIYGLVGVVMAATWFLIAFNKKMPKTQQTDGPSNIGGSFMRLLRNRHYMLGVLAQFFYVGAQIGVWSYVIRYVMQELNLNEAAAAGGKTAEQMGAAYYTASLILFTSTRFVCTWLMRYFKPRSILTFMACLAMVFTLVVAFVGGKTGVYCLIGISGCMSLMFPTIFGLSVRGLGAEDTKIAGSGQIMAIAGAALVTQIQGFVSDSFNSIEFSYLVPGICFVFIAYYGAVACRKDLPASVLQQQ